MPANPSSAWGDHPAGVDARPHAQRPSAAESPGDSVTAAVSAGLERHIELSTGRRRTRFRRRLRRPSSESGEPLFGFRSRPEKPGKRRTSESEVGPYSTYKESIKEVRTVPRAQEERQQLQLPRRFLALKAEQQDGALAAMQSVDHDLRQALLDEWEARCASTTIRNPTGYLFGIIQKALRGEFRTWAAQKAPAAQSTGHQSQVHRLLYLLMRRSRKLIWHACRNCCARPDTPASRHGVESHQPGSCSAMSKVFHRRLYPGYSGTHRLPPAAA